MTNPEACAAAAVAICRALGGCKTPGGPNSHDGYHNENGNDSNSDTPESCPTDTEYGENDWDDVVWEDGIPYIPLPEGFFGSPDEASQPSVPSDTRPSSADDNSYSTKRGHSSGARGSTKNKHQGGDARRARDRGNERGDRRRRRYR